jgi:hypothetical protein
MNSLKKQEGEKKLIRKAIINAKSFVAFESRYIWIEKKPPGKQRVFVKRSVK